MYEVGIKPNNAEASAIAPATASTAAGSAAPANDDLQTLKSILMAQDKKIQEQSAIIADLSKQFNALASQAAASAAAPAAAAQPVMSDQDIAWAEVKKRYNIED